MGDQPTQPTQSEFISLCTLQAAHAAAEAEGIEAAKLRRKLSRQEAAAMQVTIKRMEAEKAALLRR